MLTRIDWGLEKLTWALALLAFLLLFLGPSLIGAKKEATAPAAPVAATPTPTPEATVTPAPEDEAEDAATPEPTPEAEDAATPEPTPEPAPAGPDGATVFAGAGCGRCHTFAPANATGTTGPNLDQAAPSAAAVAAVVKSGRGIMPAFEGQLSEPEIQALAAFVAGD